MPDRKTPALSFRFDDDDDNDNYDDNDDDDDDDWTSNHSAAVISPPLDMASPCQPSSLHSSVALCWSRYVHSVGG